jgi:hypothetical protein
MSKEAAKCLPENIPYDHAIDLKTGQTPPYGPDCALSEKELEVLRELLNQMLETGKLDGQNPLLPSQCCLFQRHMAEVYDYASTTAELTKS